MNQSRRTARRGVIVYCLILPLITIFLPVSSISPCKLAATKAPDPTDPYNKPPIQIRSAGQYQEVKAQPMYIVDNQTILKTPICLIAAGAECFPTNVGDSDFKSEFQQLNEYLYSLYGFDNFTSGWVRMKQLPKRDPLTGALADTAFNKLFAKRFEEVELELKSLFCQSGKCKVQRYSGIAHPRSEESFKCSSGSSSGKPINFFAVHQKYNLLARGMRSNACRDTVQQNRPDYADGSYVLGRGQILFEYNGPLYDYYVCLLKEGKKCYPANYTEAILFNQYLYKNYGMTKSIERFRGGDAKRYTNESGRLENIYYDYLLKNFFCYSGECSRSTDLCTGGPRNANPLKVYRNTTPGLQSAPLLTLFAITTTASRRKLPFLLVALMFMMTWGLADAVPCDDLIDSEYKETSMTVILKSQNKTVKACLVPDGRPCVTLDFDKDSKQYPSEKFLSVHLKKLLPGLGSDLLQLDAVTSLPQTRDTKYLEFVGERTQMDVANAKRLNEATMSLRSLFCMSGHCALWDPKTKEDILKDIPAGHYCGTAKPTPISIDFLTVQELFRVSKVERVSQPILEKVCENTIGKKRMKNLDQYIPGRGLLQHKPGGPILEVAVCFVRQGFHCFPYNESESSNHDWAAYYDNDLGVLPKLSSKDPVSPPTTTEKYGPPRKVVPYKLKTTRRLFLKSGILNWFCVNGDCNVGICSYFNLKNSTTRGRIVLKLYESVLSTSTRIQNFACLSLVKIIFGAMFIY